MNADVAYFIFLLHSNQSRVDEPLNNDNDCLLLAAVASLEDLLSSLYFLVKRALKFLREGTTFSLSTSFYCGLFVWFSAWKNHMCFTVLRIAVPINYLPKHRITATWYQNAQIDQSKVMRLAFSLFSVYFAKYSLEFHTHHLDHFREVLYWWARTGNWNFVAPVSDVHISSEAVFVPGHLAAHHSLPLIKWTLHLTILYLLLFTWILCAVLT